MAIIIDFNELISNYAKLNRMHTSACNRMTLFHMYIYPYSSSSSVSVLFQIVYVSALISNYDKFLNNDNVHDAFQYWCT